MQLDAFSRFYRRQTGRFDDIHAQWGVGIPDRGAIDAAVRQVQAREGLACALRRVRNALMLRLMECDVLHDAPLAQVCHGIGCMAESAIAAAMA